MTTQDDVSRSFPEEPRPWLPCLDFFNLPAEEFQRLQKILEDVTGHPWRPLDAKLAGIELLELTAMLLDPAGWS